ncbi:hypothetical protein D3C76_1506330 [compost metagenome]
MRLVHRRTRLQNTSGIVAKNIEAHAIYGALMITLGRAGADTGGIQLRNGHLDSDILQLALNHFRNRLADGIADGDVQ